MEREGRVKFGAVPASEAEGAILAHGLKAEDRTFKKGRVLDRRDVDDLLAAGIAAVIAARLEEGDVGEDEAARTIAEAVTGAGISAGRPFTGRVNLFARDHGVAVVDAVPADEGQRLLVAEATHGAPDRTQPTGHRPHLRPHEASLTTDQAARTWVDRVAHSTAA